MARKRGEVIEEAVVETGWYTLTSDEKIEFLKNIIAEMFIHLGETDLLEKVTKGDSEFKPKSKSKGGD